MAGDWTQKERRGRQARRAGQSRRRIAILVARPGLKAWRVRVCASRGHEQPSRSFSIFETRAGPAVRNDESDRH